MERAPQLNETCQSFEGLHTFLNIFQEGINYTIESAKKIIFHAETGDVIWLWREPLHAYCTAETNWYLFLGQSIGI